MRIESGWEITRRMSDRITDTVAGIHEVHGNGSFAIENRKFDDWVEKLFKIRMVWTLWGQTVKVTNNFFTAWGPFWCSSSAGTWP